MVFVVVVGAALLHPPKSSSCVIAGAPQPELVDCVCVVVVVGGAGCAGAGDAHASALPQASMLENPEKVAAGAAAGAGFGAAGWDRLNAEFNGGDAIV